MEIPGLPNNTTGNLKLGFRLVLSDYSKYFLMFLREMISCPGVLEIFLQDHSIFLPIAYASRCISNNSLFIHNDSDHSGLLYFRQVYSGNRHSATFIINNTTAINRSTSQDRKDYWCHPICSCVYIVSGSVRDRDSLCDNCREMEKKANSKISYSFRR